MSRVLRWPTLEDAIDAQYFKMREQFRAARRLDPTLPILYTDLEVEQMAIRMSEQLTVAACDPYEVCPTPKEFQCFYNPETNTLYQAYFFNSDYLKTWVWNNTDFSLEDNPVLEFHHDVYLNTIGSP